MTPQEIRTRIARLDHSLAVLAEDCDAIEDGVRHIDVDLSNTCAEFVASTKRQPHDYYSWRRKAKWAKMHKLKALERKRREAKALEQERTQLSLHLYAVESGYRGQNPTELLRASYYLLMEVVEQASPRLDSSQVGLIAAVKELIDHEPAAA